MQSLSQGKLKIKKLLTISIITILILTTFSMGFIAGCNSSDSENATSAETRDFPPQSSSTDSEDVIFDTIFAERAYLQSVSLVNDEGTLIGSFGANDQGQPSLALYEKNYASEENKDDKKSINISFDGDGNPTALFASGEKAIFIAFMESMDKPGIVFYDVDGNTAGILP